MADPRSPRRNDRADDIWFVASGDGGSYAPVHRNGCIAFVATALWILFCGIAGMVVFILTTSAWCFVAMLAAVVPALIAMATLVRRHS